MDTTTISDYTFQFFSKNGEIPCELPVRFILPDDSSRYSYTCSLDDIYSAGFTGPYVKPSVDYPHKIFWSSVTLQYILFDLRTINIYTEEPILVDSQNPKIIVRPLDPETANKYKLELNSDLLIKTEIAKNKINIQSPNPSGWLAVANPYLNQLDVIASGIPYDQPWTVLLPTPPQKDRNYYQEIELESDIWFANAKYDYEINGWRIYLGKVDNVPVEFKYPPDWVPSGSL